MIATRQLPKNAARQVTSAVPLRPRGSVCCRASQLTHNEQQPTAPAVASRRAALALGASVAVSTAFGGPAQAGLKDYLLNPDDPIQEVSVVLGSEDSKFIFNPSTLEFTQGQLTRLKLSNPSKLTHYFTAFEFAEKVFTILVLAGDPAVEVKGGIQEVALKAGASAQWLFIPMKAGKYPLRCTVKGHDAMVGTIIVNKPAAAQA